MTIPQSQWETSPDHRILSPSESSFDLAERDAVKSENSLINNGEDSLTQSSVVFEVHSQKTSFWDFIREDWKTIKQRDPAAKNDWEILFCYPGLHAIWLHRFTHWLYGLSVPLVPRLFSYVNRWWTGVDIHPGAKIGKGVFIDHGMGVVIGETAIVGDYSLIYQGVTLGGTGKDSGKRHPTLGEGVVVGSGAKVLGNISIGNQVRIGAGSVVLRDVPSHCTVVGIPGRIIRQEGIKSEDQDHNRFPDLEAEMIRILFGRIKDLETQVQQLLGDKNVDSITHFPDHLVDRLEDSRSLSDSVIQDFIDGAGI